MSLKDTLPTTSRRASGPTTDTERAFRRSYTGPQGLSAAPKPDSSEPETPVLY